MSTMNMWIFIQDVDETIAELKRMKEYSYSISNTSISDEGDENLDDENDELVLSSSSRKRLRKRDQTKWKSVVAKKKRALGQQYLGRRYNKETNDGKLYKEEKENEESYVR